MLDIGNAKVRDFFAMIDAAVIGLGRWGKSLVTAVQGKSPRLRFVHGVSKEPDDVRAFAGQHGFRLSTDLADAIADPAVQAVFLATPHSLHVPQIEAVARARQARLVREAAGADPQGGRARGRCLPRGRHRARQRQQQALLRLDA